ncbi:uncharacterized protein PpBr36_05688 [Pyricularia pennisetigena]|uniref:uncharacterized protein n=1 Tax=Pyricularia pennisetigena TaxID=1578925 RepID=UPI00114F0DC4|nr:uncharacterized protein PpBr36_05688 [Pyricularia pennisetigena]TLS23764.1 hypothetical protein PpBr36_05688 [Pyricularia pennisetigena]
MLITSSQASVALTAMIVVACTLALFLSGYAIQQRTLRDLRAAIKPAPRPSPQVFIQESAGWQAAAAKGEFDDSELESGGSGSVADDNADGPVVEVKLKDSSSSSSSSMFSMFGAGGSKGAAAVQKPLSRVERRRKIKEDIKKLSQGESPVYYQRRLW